MQCRKIIFSKSEMEEGIIYPKKIIEIEEEISEEKEGKKLELDDFIAVYPPLSQEHFQTYMTAKKEFQELASSTREKTPVSGQYYKHQELIMRYMRAYDKLMLFHLAGSGKSCSLSAVTEFFKRSQEAQMISAQEIAKTTNISQTKEQNRVNFRKVYFLVHGPLLVEEMKKQLVCKCPFGQKYLNEKVLAAKDERSRRNNLSRSIKTWYEIYGYGKFINKILGRVREGGKTVVKAEKRMTDEEIKRKYSNSIFVIDEAHNLRNDAMSGEDQEEISTLYREYWRVLHLVEGCKIILATATPMVNSVNDIVRVMNLILPADRQLDEKRNYANATLEEMRPYFEGRISYVRELDIGAVPIPQCNRELVKKGYSCMLDVPIEIAMGAKKKRVIQAQSIVYKSIMSDFQLKVYREAMEDGTSLSSKPRQSSNFVFPDMSYGETGFKKYTKTIDQGNSVYEFTTEMKKLLGTSIERLAKYSTKFASIVSLIKQNSEGNVFCYSEFKDAGAFLLGVCLKQYGFDQFIETSSVFETKGGGMRPFCASGSNGVEKRIRASFTRKPRFALLVPGTNFEAILELFNSAENVNGEYIRIIVGSAVAKEGINLLNTQEIHLVEPGWHRSGTYQALSRGIRSGSHDLLIEQKKKKDPLLNSLEIRVYFHAAISEDASEVTSDLRLLRESERKDIEIHHMERIMKQTAIDCQIHYERNVRATDLDGTPVCDYQECRYKCSDPTPKELGIFPESEYVDYSTYDIFYGEDVKRKIREDLQEMYQQNTILERKDIDYYLVHEREALVDLALYESVNGSNFKDRFGMPVVLNDRSPYYYVAPVDIHTWYYQENVSTVENISLSQYMLETKREEEEQKQMKIYTQKNITKEDLRALLESLALPRVVSLLEQSLLYFHSPELPGFSEEDRETVRENVRLIIEYFTDADVLYLIAEPKMSIERKKEELMQRVLGRGKGELKKGKKLQLASKSMAKKIKITKEEIVGLHEELSQGLEQLQTQQTEEQEAEQKGKEEIGLQTQMEVEENLQRNVEMEGVQQVYIHTLLDLDSMNAYNRTVRLTKPGDKIRIWRVGEEDQWRDVHQYELPIYSATLRILRVNKLQDIVERSTIFGIVDHGLVKKTFGKFWIRDTRKGTLEKKKLKKAAKEEEEAEEMEDDRFKGRGFECENTQIYQLIDVLWELNTQHKIQFPEDIEERPVPTGKEAEQVIRKNLLREYRTISTEELYEFSQEKLEFFYVWTISRVPRPTICSIIRTYFETYDLMYEIKI